MSAPKFTNMFTAVFILASVNACTSNTLRSSSNESTPQKKESEKAGASQEKPSQPSKPSTSTPIATPQQTQQEPTPQKQTPPPASNSEDKSNAENSTIPQTQVNPPQEKTVPKPETVKPESNSTVEKANKGKLVFNAIVFVNMEYGAHAIDAGNMVVVRDATSKKVIAASDFTLASVQNAKRVNAPMSGYPVAELSSPLTVINKSLPDRGSALVSICPVSVSERQNGQYSCSNVNNQSADRPTGWQNLSTSYVRNGDNIELQNKPSGQSSDVQFGLSFAHPLAMGVVGVNAPQFADASSPLVLDLNLDQEFDLIDVKSPLFDIRFDLFSEDLKPKILRTVVSKTGWVGPRDGLLAIDLNKNGKIDNGSELFGEYSQKITPSNNAWSLKNFDDGFAALDQYDLNRDGQINEEDLVFSQLKIWQDLNQNGICDPGELKNLKDFGIVSISLQKQNQSQNGVYPRVANNEIRLVGHYQTEAGVKGKMADVWFTRQRLHTSSK